MTEAIELFNLRDRVAVLTGGCGLLGREYADVLAEAGAHVVIADLADEAAVALASELTNRCGVKCAGVRTDVTNKESVGRMVDEAMTTFGRIDILVNNAAHDPKFDPQNAAQHHNAFEDYPLELWNQSLAVDLTGAFLCAQAVTKPMLSRGKGVIVNISSTYGVVGPDQRLYERMNNELACYKPVAYSVTKSGILGLTRYLATYLAGKNIRVNSLTPGGVFNDHDLGFTERYSQRTPLGRMAQKNEYSAALLFLVSDASSYMTGANLVVDGGWTAW
jgi:NAD(P)-dependent dehydrogenase (short-subunit alcohol dehydrogenase family)